MLMRSFPRCALIFHLSVQVTGFDIDNNYNRPFRFQKIRFGKHRVKKGIIKGLKRKIKGGSNTPPFGAI